MNAETIEKTASKSKIHSIVSASGKEYFPVIGLEIHAELKTRSKMFCSCENNADETAQNKNICPICMGHPGTLPTLNKEAIRHVIRVGTALGSNIADYTEWDRKNYFYPDIPKGYQITQFAYPLVQGGSIKVRSKIDAKKGAKHDVAVNADATARVVANIAEHEVTLTRIHLEEDTASSSHDHGSGSQGDSYSLVDFNRAGVPLMELVTDPVIHDAKTAANFAKELQLLLRALGAGDANMEKGEMRVEANISVSTDPTVLEETRAPFNFKKFGTKVEVKNLNSFRSAERAIEYELERHIDLIERGEKIVQETRGFDETTGKTFSQRAKEDSHDYRYFPDPDLPKLFVSEIPEFNVENIKSQLPELPWDRRMRYINNFGMKDEDAEMFVQNEEFQKFFEAVSIVLKNPEKISLAVNYITSDIAGLIKKNEGKSDTKSEGKSVSEEKSASNVGKLETSAIRITPEYFSEIIEMTKAGELSSRGAKDLLALYWSDDEAILTEISGSNAKNPKKIAEERGMIQKNDPEALKKMAEEIIAAHPTVAADYKAGKQASLQFLVGQIMKIGKGSVNPQLAKEILLQILG